MDEMWMDGRKMIFTDQGGILTKTAIKEAISNNKVTINPYDENCVGSCSYDIHTGYQYAIYKDLKFKRVSGTHWEYKKNEFPDEHGMFDGHWVEVIDYEEGYNVIDPYNPSTYISEVRDIPANGLICQPGEVYLIETLETLGSNFYEPILTSRSSLGRLGVDIAFAIFGDIGFNGTWTLQVTCKYPIIIRANMKIGQIYFLTPSQEVTEEDLYKGKYNGATGVRASEYYKDVE